MDQKERMLKNLPYKAWMDGLSEERRACQEKLWEFNNLPPERWEERPALLKKLLGGLGERSILLPPLRCDYGTNIFIGEGVELNYNLTVLDVGRVHIGAALQGKAVAELYKLVDCICVICQRKQDRRASCIDDCIRKAACHPLGRGKLVGDLCGRHLPLPAGSDADKRTLRRYRHGKGPFMRTPRIVCG